MAEGYIYCFSNPSMPGILKVGMTERTPADRLSEANASDTWRPPTPYQIQFAKKVSNPLAKEKTIHVLLEQYTERIHPRREFFRVSPEEVQKLFDLMDGEVWVEPTVEEDDEDTSSETRSRTTPSGCRDMTKCFTNGQRIRHVLGINKMWIGVYNLSTNVIVYDGKNYTSLSHFALSHIRVYTPTRNSVNGWQFCECEVDGKWISTLTLPELANQPL
jgi:hypothetical protein